MPNSTKRLYGIIGLLALLLLAVLLSGGLFGRSALGGPAGSAPFGGSEVGRYQLTSAGTSSNPFVFLLDTKTGRCWLETTPGDTWREVTPNYAKP